MQIMRDVSLREYSAMKVGGAASTLFVVENDDDVAAALAQIEKEGLSVFVVGGGTNTFFGDGAHEKLALLSFATKNITESASPIEGVVVTADAGVTWDDLVRYVAAKNLWGLEALAGIPGTVGAAPVQNIGAYGAEVGDTIEAVIVYDRKQKEVRAIPGRQCAFGYRTSIFNAIERDRYIILRVRFWLMSKRRRALPKEADDAKTPALAGEAIRAVRDRKIPPLAEANSCGSFFKTAFVPRVVGEKLLAKYPTMPHFLAGENMKIPSGWLVEESGMKGMRFGHVAISSRHALVLTTDGEATAKDVLAAEAKIIGAVKEKFGILLTREPNYLP